ncbi:mechanosensitive ion channel protein MscS [Paenibacillus beijingensis]|uniref:Mechanosensitive ion channel protein MscS n=1 Tax=Paenibacillus beijingensis TaxID=1126833 RepID=A0A0D5NRY0_9BACL|nr:mechanosensitive ion channel protein MscS [Paenibacillus beijingensis]
MTLLVQQWMKWIMDLFEWAQWRALGISLIRIIVIIALGRVFIWVIYKTIDKLLQKDAKVQLHTRRMKTLGKLLKNVATYVTYFIVILLVLSEFNINLGPLLAGAGVLGLAVGFGAQSLVKDVITGFFIILEDQFAVGDVIQAGKFKGTVEVIGLRATRIQSWTGEVHIIPNGAIVEVTNFSLHNSLAVVDITIAYEQNVEQASDVIKSKLETFKDPNLAKQPELLGLQTLTSNDLTLRIIAECMPNTQVMVTRRLNVELKHALDEAGIAMPAPTVVTYHKGESGGVKSGA